MMTIEDTTEVRHAQGNEVCNARRPDDQRTRITKDKEKGQATRGLED
jgi:hypothetical protein